MEFRVRQFECVYCDVKNPSRSTRQDQTREVDCFVARGPEGAREAVYEILRSLGGARSLLPKIISSDSRSLWIECEEPYGVYPQSRESTPPIVLLGGGESQNAEHSLTMRLALAP
jgi:hypothetical protein